MRRHPIFQTLGVAANFLFIASLILLVVGGVWEYSVRSYLKGFADAIVPLSATPEQQAEAILAWMKQGPARRAAADTESLALRDPQDTLNYQQLLNVCGSATNAFVNLAHSSGLKVRRLLLLGPDRLTRHVVAEVHLNDRWVVVDPAFHFSFRDAEGQLLTREQLHDPRLLREATQKVNGYPSEYTFERTVHVRLTRLPWIGSLLRKTLNTVLPSWEEAINWTLVLERESTAAVLAAVLLLCFALAGRFALNWYGESRLGLTRLRLRDQLLRVGAALSNTPR